MHSIRSLLSVTCAIIGFALLAPPASQAAAPTFTTFTLDKVCSAATGFTNMVPSSCNITGSNIAALIGGKVTYYGPTISPTFVSSTVVLNAGIGNTASGFCMVYRTAVPLAGMCAFHAGTGSLAGFQAVVKVTGAAGAFHWEGVETPLPTS